MNIIRWVIALPLIVGAVLFALANPEIVSITWNPFEPAINLPLYFVALTFLGMGFLLGTFIAWLGMSKTRKERRQQKKQIKQLEKDINEANEKVIETLTKYKPSASPSLPNNVIESDHAY